METVMIASVLAFLASPFGKLATYVAAAVFAGVVIVGLVLNHDRTVRAEQAAKDAKAQLEVVLKNQAAVIAQQQEMATIADQAARDARVKTEALDDRISSIDQTLSSAEVLKADRPASDVIKKALELLKKGETK